MSRCRHRRSHRRSHLTAATTLPPSRCAPPPRFALPPLPAPPPSCHQRRAVALPPPPRRRQAAADVTLSRCRHRHSCRAAATALPPSCCAPPPSCLQPRSVALPPPPLPPQPRRISLVGCCVVVRRPLPSGLFCLFGKTGGEGLFEGIRCVPFPDAFEAWDVGWAARARAPDCGCRRRRRRRRRLCRGGKVFPGDSGGVGATPMSRVTTHDRRTNNPSGDEMTLSCIT